VSVPFHDQHQKRLGVCNNRLVTLVTGLLLLHAHSIMLCGLAGSGPMSTSSKRLAAAAAAACTQHVASGHYFKQALLLLRAHCCCCVHTCRLQASNPIH
jgi:hypothetical protein